MARQTQRKRAPRWDIDYRDLVEGAGDGIYALDLQGRFVYYNASFGRTLGYTQQDLLGKHFRVMLTPESTQVALENFNRGVARHELTCFEVDALAKDGTTTRLEIRGTTLFHEGQAVGRQGIARDISELYRLRMEVQTKAEQLALVEERSRIAQELSDMIARVVFRADQEPTNNELLSRFRDSLADDVAATLGLSDIDRRIVQLISRGFSNRQIGEQVHLSAETVKDHVKRLMVKLNVGRRTELVAEAARVGLLSQAWR